MKKLLSLLLVATMALSLVACGEANSESESTNKKPPIKETTDNLLEEENNDTGNDDTNEDLETENGNDNNLKLQHEFFYDTLDELEEKDNVDFKLCGISEAPFNLLDFEDYITEFNASYVSTQITGLLKDFNVFVNGTTSMLPSKYPSDGHAVVDLNNGGYFRFGVVANEDDNKQNVLKAIEENRYHYYTMYDVDKFLDIDMTGIDFSTQGSRPNAKPLLEKIVEKFGKPTSINMHYDDETYASEHCLMAFKYYEAIYEFEDYVLSFYILETQYVYDNGQGGHDIELQVSLFTPESWEIYKSYQ